MDKNLTILTTESRNERTMNIDVENTADILRIMNEEDQKVATAVNAVLPDIEATVEYVVQSLKSGGRLIYIGAGTSGRLGVLDAVECPPTFSTDPSTVQGIMAGGEGAFVKAVEGAEDSEEGGVQDLQRIELTSADTVIGIAASGRTPYVIGALKYAKSIGAKAIALSCNENAAISQVADRAIEVVVGPEILTGSTRLKSATAHKMILNMISTASMIKLGKAYENLMIDVNVSNYKLKERAIGIIEKVTAASYEEAKAALEEANNEVKTAIVMIKTQATVEEARTLLEKNDGYVRKAIQQSK
ncbi:N-acetylmuramic acid 6-phosphate etherase [Priestia aryabhattai]|uniref:N-acetylmuramic acid 6-phosphate etherase n=1 Tax=Bacillus sp. CBEL-1 TaxID=2502980 RepID=UPI000BA0919B|nr:N-acetylmuramic acid 6-phosphate etherase [Bacillus sp. CBEL-1]OZT11918.1 N-acetylmuramic acid 6-phosphate etherase [Priestia aryabhattai]TDB50234.1 N-acetylmuramic acid 6-phosphate etherase [Bacillus sp. CBEL-1]